MDGATGSRENMYLQKYKVGPKVIGHGQFGKVKVAEHALTGHKVAIKILNRRMIKEKNIEERESKILRLLMHPHIVRLYEVIETPTDIFLVMEYVQCGDLFDYIAEKGKLHEDEARRIFQQIISGVEYCHINMVVHRDLKPENLLLDSGYNVKIADFGLSNIMRDGHFLKTSCGSLHYAAPEVISGELYAGPAVDVWSCGVILYAILCGTLPFDDGNTSILHKKIKGGIYTLPSHLSVSARDLIRRMFVVDPVKRISIPDIRQHPWFQAHLLPHYLAVPPPVEKMMQIDEEILRKVVSLGFHRNILVDSLHKRLQNEGTVAYYLLLDNRFGSSAGAEFPGSIVGAPVGAHFPANTEYQGMGSQPQLPVGRKWALGLQSGAHPHEIMTEVLKALEELNISWKKIGHFVMKCRWVWVPRVPPGRYVGTISTTMQRNSFFGDELTIAKNDSVSDPTNVVKFELQIFKTREERKYLLDLQRVQGPQFLFLDLCASFLAQLGVF